MIRAAQIVTEPERSTRQDGATVYTAIVEVAGGEDPPPRLYTILGGPARGLACAYRKGDRVWIVIVGGTSIVVAAAGDVGGDGVNHYLLARTGAKARIGAEGADGSWSAIAMHDSHKAAIDYIAEAVAGLLGGPGVAWKEALPTPRGAEAAEAQVTAGIEL